MHERQVDGARREAWRTQQPRYISHDRSDSVGPYHMDQPDEFTTHVVYPDGRVGDYRPGATSEGEFPPPRPGVVDQLRALERLRSSMRALPPDDSDLPDE